MRVKNTEIRAKLDHINRLLEKRDADVRLIGGRSGEPVRWHLYYGKPEHVARNGVHSYIVCNLTNFEMWLALKTTETVLERWQWQG